MRRKKFIALFETLKERVEKEGKGSVDWLLGYLEGKGNQKLTGYQIGALIHLLVIPDKVPVVTDSEVVGNAETYFK